MTVIDTATAYIRESNIADAAHIYTALKVDNLETLEISYVTPVTWSQVSYLTINFWFTDSIGT